MFSANEKECKIVTKNVMTWWKTGKRGVFGLCYKLSAFGISWLPWQVLPGRQVLPGITNTRVIPEIFGNQIEGVRVKIGSIKPSQRVEGY